jgi:hypothetical protein
MIVSCGHFASAEYAFARPLFALRDANSPDGFLLCGMRIRASLLPLLPDVDWRFQPERQQGFRRYADLAPGERLRSGPGGSSR